ncbi:protein-cysteine N-palmitoyltransferase HHAT-like protein isoform X2 [Lutra lutra]|uniref:protein-cysteine N-palmitoyltransferase HHAT-like protein isoform X2 n=1 Tax=Lutra lutra TaxID=9657 RepID=UPI001FD0EE22|nr:protein-cysteine N-palmitoyltransferase HHAT-like protein isoform X2 [Lutra lutra]
MPLATPSPTPAPPRSSLQLPVASSSAALGSAPLCLAPLRSRKATSSLPSSTLLLLSPLTSHSLEGVGTPGLDTPHCGPRAWLVGRTHGWTQDPGAPRWAVCQGPSQPPQDGAHRKAFRESVRPGWEYIGRKMDVADFEWVMWFTSFRNIIVFALSGHVLFAKLCTMVAPQLRSWMYAVYGALAVLGTMGPWYLLLLLGHCVSLYLASLLGQPWLCLGLSLASLASFKLDPLISWQSGLVTGTFDLQEVLFHGGSGFTVLRCASFALESCAHPDRRYSLADLLKYNFYLPFFFFGPIMTFDRFHAQMSQVEPVRREGELWRIRAQAGLSVVAIMAVDIFFHFFYILTIPSDLKFANRLPDSALAGLAYSNLVYDWVKAAVLFGVVNTVARLDHLDPPQAPKCITALYVFAETHFDRGINDWLCKYVYDHIGGEHSEVIPELGATVATFAITTLWLGPCDIVYLWSFLNCFGLNFELWAQKLAEWGPLAQIEASLSEQMSRRVRALFGAVNFWAIIMYNLVSLNSLEFTELVARRLLLTGVDDLFPTQASPRLLWLSCSSPTVVSSW